MSVASAWLKRRWLVIAGVVGLLVIAHPWLTPVRADGKSDRAKRQQMSRWKNELGLKNCAYCHVKEGRKFDYEADTPKKAIADYCNENFVKKLKTEAGKAVTCRTCHNRKTAFLPRPEGEGGGDDEGDEKDEKVEGR